MRLSPAARGWLAPVFIVLIGLGAYANSFHGAFVLDEQSAIVDNPNIRSVTTAFSAPKEVGFAGRPVVSLSFALNYRFAPGDAREVFTVPPGAPPAAADALYRNLWGYHAANLAIHLLAALTLFGILRRSLRRLPHGADAAAATPLAFIVSLLWVVHPLCTGSITYVAQRVESLMGLFFLLTLYCSIRAGEALFPAGLAKAPPAAGLVPDSVPLSAGMAWTIAALTFCALGMGTKEVMVAAPLVVVLYDWVFFAGHRADTGGAGVGRPWWRARLPLYGGFVACWALLAALVLANPRGASIGVGLHGWTSWLYLTTQAEVIVHYLRLALVPAPLVLDYEWPAAASLGSVLPHMAFLASLLALTVWGLLRRRPAALLGTWFFLILGPSSSVLPIVTEIAAEHRMYLPLCAVLTLAVVGVFRAGTHFLSSASGAPAPPRTAPALAGFVVAAVAVAVAGCAYLTAERNEDYSSYERIWADTIAKRPGNARARSNYGTALFEQGRLPEAEAALRDAIAIREAYPEAQANLGAVLCSQGRLEEGVRHLRRAIELAPHYRDAYRNLGEALATLGRNSEALQAYRQALTTAPDDPRLLSRVAWLLATAPEAALRDGREAVRLAERAVLITDGRDADSIDTLAAAYAEAGRFNEAVSTQERAIAVAGQAGLAAMIPHMQARVELYRAGQKFRQAAPQRG